MKNSINLFISLVVLKIFLVFFVSSFSINSHAQDSAISECNAELQACYRRCAASRQLFDTSGKCDNGCRTAVAECRAEVRAERAQERKDKEEKEKRERENQLKEKENQQREIAAAEYAKGNYIIPQRSPDVVLICRPISLKNYQRSDGSNSQSGSYSSNSNSTTSCGGQGWENKRLDFRIWISEGRCDGYRCNISDNGYSWSGYYINRLTGQTSDVCHTYSCERSSSSAPKF